MKTAIQDQVFCVIDTETCGDMDPAKDAVVELAAAWCDARGRVGHTFATFVNPGRPIPPEASGIHHITQRDVVFGAKSIEDACESLITAAPDDGNDLETDIQPYIAVAHNAAFDSARLPRFKNMRWLCTQRLAMHLFPNRENHKNQTLRYLFGGVDIPGVEPGTAHRALADCRVTAFNLGNLLHMYLKTGVPDDIGHLISYVASPIRLSFLKFGKHRLVPFDARDDFGDWKVPTSYLSSMPKWKEDMDDDLAFTIKDELSRRYRLSGGRSR